LEFAISSKYTQHLNQEMNKKDIYQQLTVLIQAGKTKEAFAFLNQQDLDKITANNCSIIQAEYNLLHQDELKGTISFEERQMRRNRIHDKLLKLLEEEPATGLKYWLASPLLKVLIPMVLLTAAILIWWKVNHNPYTCPTFPQNYNNKVMVLPFQKVGGQEAEPELILRNRINTITSKNNLSTKAEIGTFVKNISNEMVDSLAKQCSVDFIIWGTYSHGPNSTQLILQYQFTEDANWANVGEELIAIKDVTELYKGSMLKNMDDAIFSLCGLLAIKEGEFSLAKKWFNKVENQETIDTKLINTLKNIN